MRRLSKNQLKEIDEAFDGCKAAATALEAAIDDFNDVMTPLREKVKSALAEYNERVTDLRSVYEEMHSEASSYFGDRSERWQESDAGQTYQEWMDQLENVEIEEAELELPNELQMPDVPDFEDNSWLPPEAPGET